MIHVLLADDHAVIRDGLQALFELQPDIQVTAVVSNGRAAVQQAQHQCPDVAVLDITMPQLNGIDAALQIREHCANARIIILSIHATIEHVARALHAGVYGYLLKESAGKEIAQAVHAVHKGQRYLCQQVKELVIEGDVDPTGKAGYASPLDVLSTREREVLHLVVEGYTSAAIAAMLSLAPSTVETYRSRIMSKLKIRDVPGLVKFALRHGLIAID